DRNPGTFQIDQQIAQPLMLGQAGVGAAEQRGEVGVMGVRGPYFGAVDDEVITLIYGAGFDRGEVGAVVRLGKPLAPDLLGRGDFRDVAPFVFGRAPLHQGRPDAGDTLKVDRRRRLHAVELLLVDDLLEQGRAASAVLLGPVDAHPAAIVEL